MTHEAAAGTGENPYGLLNALREGGIIAYTTFGILLLMSAASWYILFTKLFEQQKIINQGRRARTTFWQSANLREGAHRIAERPVKGAREEAAQCPADRGRLRRGASPARGERRFGTDHGPVDQRLPGGDSPRAGPRDGRVAAAAGA